MVTKNRGYSRRAMTSAVCLLLVLTLLPSLGAQERKQGAMLSIRKIDGAVIRGELLSVQGKNLILMDTTLNGVTLNIDEVQMLTVERSSKFFQGIGIGLLSGAAVGGTLGGLSGDDPPGWFSFTAGEKAFALGLFFGAIGTAIGGVSGALAGIDEYVKIPPGSEALKSKVLAKLAVVSRAGAFTPGPSTNTGDLEMVMPRKADQQREEAARKMDERSKTERSMNGPVKAMADPKFSRFHLTIESGYALSPFGEGLKKTVDQWGFGSDISGDSWFGGYYEDYPVAYGRKLMLFRKIQLDYSIRSNLSIGIAYCLLSKCDLEGYHYVKSYSDSWGTHRTGTFMTGEFQGGAYYLLASFWPIPNGFTQKSTGKLSAGVGLADIKQTFRSDNNVEMKERPLSLIVAAEYDYFLSKNFSLGLDIDYQYIPLRIDDFSLSGHYQDTAWGSYGQTTAPVRVDLNFPGAKVNVGGFDLGLNLGFHF